MDILAKPADTQNERIYRDLRLQIVAGKIRPGERMPTEKVLAESYGVSVLTVRHAQRSLVAEGLIAKQQGRGTYVLDDVAKSRRILLICGLAAGGGTGAFSASPYFQHTIWMCREQALASDLQFASSWMESFPHPEDEPINWRVLERYSGYLFLGCSDHHEVVKWARRNQLNYVDVGKIRPGANTVWCDPVEAALLAKKAVIAGPPGPVFVVSLPGTEAGLDAISGPGILPLRAPTISSAFECECLGYQMVRDAAAGVPNAKYIFLDDILARGGTRALLETGMKPEPGQVAIVCGQQEIFPHAVPVSHITHDTGEEAGWAVEMLRAQIDGERSQECRQSHYRIMQAGDASVAAV